MNIFSIDIIILSSRKEPKLERSLRNAPALDNVSCAIHTAEAVSKKTLNSRSLVIACGHDAFESCAQRGEDCAVVYYGGSAAHPGENILENAAAVWNSSMSEKELSFNFSKLLKSLKSEYDAWLYKNLLTTAINTLPDMVWFKNTDGLHVLVNDAFCRTVHKTKEDVTNKGHCYIWDIPPEEAEAGEYMCRESDKAVMRGKKTQVFEEAVKTKDGMKQLRSYKSPILGKDGRAIGNVGTAHDVIDISNIGSELNILTENLPFPIIVCDKKWRVVKFNVNASILFCLKKHFAGSDYKKWRDKFFADCLPLPHPNDSIFEAEVTLYNNRDSSTYSLIEHPIKDMFGYVSGYYCIFSDITAKKLYENDLLHMANTDPLTKLYNRRYFFEYMNRVKNTPLTFYFMDMDNFKAVNDTFGHKCGDLVLVTTAALIKETFPEGLVARIGGDEFTAVVKGMESKDENQRTVTQLVNKVKSAFSGEPFADSVGISVGIAQTDGSDKNIDDLFAESDIQMYRQKNVRGKFAMPLRTHRREEKQKQK